MRAKIVFRALAGFIRRQLFGISILACAAVAFAFPSAFTEWGGVKLTSLVVPAIQVIMFGMGTTLSLADFMRVAKRPWAAATGMVLQFPRDAACRVPACEVAALPANVFSIAAVFLV